MQVTVLLLLMMMLMLFLLLLRAREKLIVMKSLTDRVKVRIEAVERAFVAVCSTTAAW